MDRLITECVQDTLAESRYTHRDNRQVMNEAQLQNFVRNVINEELENEGLWNQIKSGAKGAMNGFRNGGGNVMNRAQAGWNNAKGAYGAQGEVDNYDKFSGMAQQMIDAGLRPEITLGQIAQGKAGGANKFNSYNSQRAQSSRRLNNYTKR